MSQYLCPVCAYPRLEAPPEDFTICPCCGTEFGLDDFGLNPDETRLARKELRWRWLENGAPWFDPGTPQPPGWTGYKQLLSDLSPAIEISSRDVAATHQAPLVKASEPLPGVYIVDIRLPSVSGTTVAQKILDHPKIGIATIRLQHA